MKFVVINHPCSNSANVVRWIKACGHQSLLENNPCSIGNDSVLVLPGNGSFLSYFEFLEKSGWLELIKSGLNNQMPIVGICAGMQILSEKSEENCQIRALNYFDGVYKKFTGSKNMHIGRSQVKLNSPNAKKRLFGFFCHSYRFQSADPDDSVFATAKFESEVFPAILKKNNVFGFQFHPELSGDSGALFMKIIEEYLDGKR